MFDHATFDFLGALSAGQDKAWFESNRPLYEARLLGPMRHLVRVVGDRLVKLDAKFETTPLVNKTLTRLNRDMRFAKGGSPYKDHMLALFYRQGRKKQDPQLFVGLQPAEAWVGLYVGPHLLADGAPIRGVIEHNPEKLLDAARRAGVGAPDGNLLATCERYGEVKTVLAGRDAADFARGPHLVAMRRVPAEEIVRAGDGFVADCADRLEALFPLWAVYAG
nr:DUF2461 family protein [uncultured Rhodopila sp.]